MSKQFLDLANRNGYSCRAVVSQHVTMQTENWNWQKSQRFAICGMIQKFTACVQVREICDCGEKFTLLLMINKMFSH